MAKPHYCTSLPDTTVEGLVPQAHSPDLGPADLPKPVRPEAAEQVRPEAALSTPAGPAEGFQEVVGV